LAQITSGEWQSSPLMTDYRAELFDKMFVERATWLPSAPLQRVGDTVVAAPGYIWVRFWLLEGEEPIEKYFDPERNTIGFYLPLCMPVQRRGVGFFAHTLLLSLWLHQTGRLTVLGETAFDAAVAAGDLAPVEIEHAEYRIRTLTFEINQKRYPPGMVRTFRPRDE
jgi:hypothetical protein